MFKYYFTYGTDSRFPFRGGWTVVEADDIRQAAAIFRLVHSDQTPGLLNCSGLYSEGEWAGMDLERTGNLGAFLHEAISLKRIIHTKGE